MTALQRLSDSALDALNRRLRERAMVADIMLSLRALSLRQRVICEQLRRSGWPVPARYEGIE